MTAANRESFRLDVPDGGVAVVVFDQPDSPVNLLTTETMQELDGLLGSLESWISAGRVTAVVFRSGKGDSFIAGADVNEIVDLRDPEEATLKSREGQRIFRRLDRLSVPTVAAVDGTCLGGGTEMALACDHRVASDSDETKIGLPEIRLGILPGFGGSVRMPRLCGIQNALDVILAGRSVDPEKARRIGLVDRVLREDAFDEEVERFVAEVLSGKVPEPGYRKSLLEKLLEETEGGRKVLFHMARRRTEKRTEGRYPAPPRALEVIRETWGLPLDEALEVEARALGELAVTPEAKNLQRLFLLQRGARKALPEEVMERRRPVERAAVLGAGVMGGSIAELVATRDIPVLLKDIDREPLDDGLRHARKLLEKAARKGVLDEKEVGLKFALIEGTLDYEGFEDVDLVVEAVVERMQVKRQVLRETEERIPVHAVFATNTSSLSVTKLADASRRPERVLGLHFFNPVHKMPLVEVIRTEEAEEEALAMALGFALDLGKTPVLVRDGPGFLVNRLLAPYLNEAGHLLGDGASVKAVDEALTAFGMPMGPFRLLDEVGLDVARHVGEQLERAFGSRMKAPGMVESLLEDGRLGKKNGLGFYVYEDGREKKLDPEIRRLLPADEDGSAPDAGDIVRRCLYLMVNEAAYALEDGIVSDPDDVDLAMVMGTGFPPYRGGILRWADSEGIPGIVETLRSYAESLDSRFRPAPRLASMAERNETFTDPVVQR